ncbi:MAG: 1-(5-phosphoribosyl)-5-[(5-phosphoribosylamino)methylideneamino]imidazole-4-carboxamide isomerase [Fusobacteriaceae bacterium]|nr:1-(5-phosphoribosyl)-5-[(5-phosphoribosylamino)methylideneamino]imidazole-4-carboxamide isomerase [Fusobacteriaceae bacterium]MBN2837892.1 1-(5-phosphoribosyl)-5-[(5-phosphoribosylamino)methylideneamino]imidazole-4-carboxamide isomerase [Fusobacteriaceae bacterium]
MIIFPAIDLLNEQCVRLKQGDYNQKEVFNSNPVEQAKSFEEQGAKFLHLIDLDGAKEGSQKNFEVIRKIREAINIPIQVGGGIRNEERIIKLLELGVDRVILGTIAIKNRDFLKEMLSKYGEKIVVSVDAKEGKVATDGWLEDSGIDSIEFVKELIELGLKTLVYTDISKDGMMEGTNLDIYKKINELEIDLIASGGVSRMYDIEELLKMNTYGAIVGKAIYAGALSLKDIFKVVNV